MKYSTRANAQFSRAGETEVIRLKDTRCSPEQPCGQGHRGGLFQAILAPEYTPSQGRPMRDLIG